MLRASESVGGESMRALYKEFQVPPVPLTHNPGCFPQPEVGRPLFLALAPRAWCVWGGDPSLLQGNPPLPRHPFRFPAATCKWDQAVPCLCPCYQLRDFRSARFHTVLVMLILQFGCNFDVVLRAGERSVCLLRHLDRKLRLSFSFVS